MPRADPGKIDKIDLTGRKTPGRREGARFKMRNAVQVMDTGARSRNQSANAPEGRQVLAIEGLWNLLGK